MLQITEYNTRLKLGIQKAGYGDFNYDWEGKGVHKGVKTVIHPPFWKLGLRTKIF